MSSHSLNEPVVSVTFENENGKNKSILDGIVILIWWDIVTDYMSGSHQNFGGNNLRTYSGTRGGDSHFL